MVLPGKRSIVKPPSRRSTLSPSPFPERLGLHNSSVDHSIAARHQCGMIHLPTGRVCLLPERHAGGCQFSYLVPEIDRELRRGF